VLAVLIPVLLFSAIHFIVTTQVKRLLPTLVEQLSNGEYGLSYNKIRFEYFSPYLKLSKVKFAPLKQGLDTEFEVSVDSLYLSLESIIPLFLNSAVSVKEIRLVNPAVLARTNVVDKGKRNEAELHIQVGKMQENAMKFLNALSVDKCNIINGSFRFYPFPGNPANFNIEHVYLSINDLVIPEFHANDIEKIQASIKLSIRNPSIRIPDSLINIQVDNFEWDNQAHYVNIGKFEISQRAALPLRDSFDVSLDTIRIRNIDWPRWLDSGIIKVDTLIADNGDLYFESSANRNQKKKVRDTVDLKKLKFWDVIGDLEIDHFSARYIRAAIINSNPGRERNNSVIGDSLVISDLSIRPERKNPLSVGELGLGVREFQDRGSDNRFQSSFSHLQVKGNTLELNNYMIVSTKRARMGEGAKLFIPSLFIEGISLEEIIDKKASIRQIRMESPELTMKKLPPGRPDGKFSLEGLNELKPYVDVEKLVLNNAKVTIRDNKDTSVSMGTREFSAVVLTRSALKAPDMESFLSSFRDVTMKHFYYITPKAELQLFDGAVDYNSKSLHFARLEGYINSRKVRADLYNVTIVAGEELRPFEKDVVWHFRHIDVESGTLDVRLDSADNNSNVNDDPNKLLGLVDSMNLRNIIVRFSNEKIQGKALVNSAVVAGNSVHPGFYEWEQARMDADDIFIQGPDFSVNAKAADFNSMGLSVLNGTEITVNKPSLKMNVSTSEINFRGLFRNIDPRRVVFDEISLVRPKLNIAVKNDGKEIEATAGVSQYFQVYNFNLDEPVVNISLIRPDEQIDIITGGETIRGENLIWEKTNENAILSFNNLRSELEGIRMTTLEKEIFKGGSISASVNSFVKKDSLPPVISIAHFDIVSVDVGRIHDNDTMDIKTGGIKIGRVNDLALQKDSIIQAALKLPPVTVLPGSFRFNTPKEEIGFYNVEVNTQEGFLSWDSLNIINRVPRDTFFARQPFEKDYITLSTGKVRADDLKPVIYNRDTTVYIRKLSLDPLDFKVERDKRVTDDTVKYRPLLARMFNRLRFPLKLDTINLKNSVIWHNVIDEKTEKEGTIFFTEVNGTVTNIRNFDIQKDDSIRVDLTSKLMSRGQLRFQFRESYEDSIQGFLMSVRMGGMEMQELNRLMIPLNNVRVDRGVIRDVSMRVKGNEYFAYGSMDMNYENLKVSVLNVQNKKKGIVSWLANILVRGKNSKTGIIYTERLTDKSVFNFWSKISLNGLMTNLGVRKNGKQVRKFYRSLEKYELPPDLF
jgi:hypothetical protein